MKRLSMKIRPWSSTRKPCERPCKGHVLKIRNVSAVPDHWFVHGSEVNIEALKLILYLL